MPPNFLRSKKKKGNKGKKERVSKQKVLKGCHQGRNIIVLQKQKQKKLVNKFAKS